VENFCRNCDSHFSNAKNKKGKTMTSEELTNVIFSRITSNIGDGNKIAAILMRIIREGLEQRSPEYLTSLIADIDADLAAITPPPEGGA
jgi:thymidine phosphorylase